MEKGERRKTHGQSRFESDHVNDLYCPVATCVDPRDVVEDISFYTSTFDKSLLKNPIPTVFDTRLTYPVPSYIGTRLTPEDFKDSKFVSSLEEVTMPDEAISLLMKSAIRTKSMPESEVQMGSKHKEDAPETNNESELSRTFPDIVRQKKFNINNELNRETQIRNINQQFEAPVPQVHPETGRKLKRAMDLDLCGDYNLEELKLAILLKEQNRMMDGYTVKIVDEHDAHDCRLLVLKAGSKKSKKNDHSHPSQHQRKGTKNSSQKQQQQQHDDERSSFLIENDNFSLSSSKGSEHSQDFEFSDSDKENNNNNNQQKDIVENNVISEDSNNKNQEEMNNDNNNNNDDVDTTVMVGDEHILSSAFLCDEIKDNGRKFALFIPNEGVEDEHALMIPLPKMLRARDSIPLINKNLRVQGNTIYDVDKPIFIKYVDKKNIVSHNENDIYGESDSEEEDEGNNNNTNVQRKERSVSSESISTGYSYSDDISDGLDG